MLYGKHLGLARPEARLSDSEDKQAQKVRNAVRRIKEIAKKSDWFQPKALYQWVNSWSVGDSIIWNNGSGDVEIKMPRQDKEPFSCAADWVAPEGKDDAIAMFLTTSGKEPNEVALKWKEEGKLLDSFILQGVFKDLLDRNHGSLRWSFVNTYRPVVADQLQLISFGVLEEEGLGSHVGELG